MLQNIRHTLLTRLLWLDLAHPQWAALLTGLLLSLGLLPDLSPSRPTRGAHIVGGALLLVLALVLAAGPVVAAAQPVYAKMGRLPGWGWAGLATILLVAGRLRAGRRYLLLARTRSFVDRP